MAASEAAVTAAQAKAGCWFEETVAGLFCNTHHCYADQRHETRSECDVIASIADAAVDADRASIQAETLREAAHDLSEATEGPDRRGTAGWAEPHRDVYSLAIEECRDALRARADRIEGKP